MEHSSVGLLHDPSRLRFSKLLVPDLVTLGAKNYSPNWQSDPIYVFQSDDEKELPREQFCKLKRRIAELGLINSGAEDRIRGLKNRQRAVIPISPSRAENDCLNEISESTPSEIEAGRSADESDQLSPSESGEELWEEEGEARKEGTMVVNEREKEQEDEIEE